MLRTQNCVIWIRKVLLFTKKHICKGITVEVESRFDDSNYELNRPLLKGKNKKVIGVMKGELNGIII